MQPGLLKLDWLTYLNRQRQEDTKLEDGGVNSVHRNVFIATITISNRKQLGETRLGKPTRKKVVNWVIVPKREGRVQDRSSPKYYLST